MDKRRRRFVMHDVYFLDDPLGTAVFDRFGACGVALWMGFIAACKKNHVQGEMSYADPAEALAVMGLPGMQLVDPAGEPFTLDDFWRLLGDHKVTRRRRAGRRVHVLSRRWTEWQVNPRSPKPGERKPRSEGLITDTLSDDYCDETALDTDTDTDTSLSAGDEPVEREWDKVWNLLAKHDAEVFRAKGGTIGTPGWFVTAARTRELNHADELGDLWELNPEWSVQDLVVAFLEGEAKPTRPHLTVARPPCEICNDRGVIWPDDSPVAVDCECKYRRTA